jgi:hypothetical protein
MGKTIEQMTLGELYIYLSETNYVTEELIDEYIDGKTKTQLKEVYGSIIKNRKLARQRIALLESEEVVDG